MINLTKNINRFLQKKRRNAEPITGKDIACAFAKLIIGPREVLGMKIDTQLQISKDLEVPVSALHTAYTILRFEYKIIEGWQGGGTHIIKELTKEHRSAISKLIKRHSATIEDLPFDRDYLQRLIPGREREISQALTVYENLSAKDQQRRVIPALTTALTKVMTEKMQYYFSEREIFYINDHSELITYCCEIFCQKKRSILMLTPSCNPMIDAVRRSRRNITFLPNANILNLATDIEAFLTLPHLPVGIIYIGSSAPYPLMSSFDTAFWKRLLEIQKIHQFKILVDDRLPMLVKMPNLFKDMLPGANNAIIHIAALSLHHKLSDVRVVAASAVDIRKMKNNYRNKGLLLHPSVGYGLLNLIQTSKLDQYEPNAYGKIEKVVEAAKKYLLETRKFVEEYIIHQQAYYFYLELQKGSFPPNLHKKLLHSKIYVPDTKDLCLGEDFSKGIVISVAAYSSTKVVLEALTILMEYL